MIIVLISWRIKPRAVQEFRDWWRDQTVSQGLSGLFGEFLTEPVSASELRYKSNDMRPANGEYLPFVNVELWRDEDTFYAAVGQLFRDDQPLLDFEAKPRERTVLRQCESHRGDWVLVGAENAIHWHYLDFRLKFLAARMASWRSGSSTSSSSVSFS